MNAIGFHSASGIYECCASNRIAIITVEHNGAKALSVDLGRLRKELGDAGTEQYWEQLLAPLYFYRFRISAIPLPFNSPWMIPDRLLDVVRRQIPIAKNTAPRYYEQLARIAGHIEALIASGEAPLLEALRRGLSEPLEPDMGQERTKPRHSTVGKSIYVVLKGRVDVSLTNAVRAAVGRDEVEVVGIPGLRSLGVADCLIAVGTLGWFPEHFQTAPRSRRLVSMRFNWTGDSSDPKPALVSTDPKEFASRWKSVTRAVPKQAIDEIKIDDDTVPRTDWSVIDTVMHGLVDGGSAEEKIPCKLLILTNRCAVYVDNRADKTVDVITINENRRRDRIATQELEIGMFVLLRTAGGGDLIAPMANNILGKQAVEVRASQERWKKALGRMVTELGDDVVINKLQAVGCRRANYQNLHNWIGERSIRPEYDEDFRAILSLSGLGSESKVFVENANRIDKAHRRAGFVIRRALLKRVEEVNLDQMIAAGFLEIQLTVAVGGSFTAYRIDDISPEEYLVPSSHVGHPQVIGGRAWQG